MLALGLSAADIAAYEGKQDVAGGAAAAYLIFTAWTAVRPLPGDTQRMNVALLALPLVFGIGGFAEGWAAVDMPGHQIDGVPAGMQFFLSTIFVLASGSFVAQLVRMPFIPASMRGLGVILFLSAGPLVALLYWMWRVRLRQSLRGLVTASRMAREAA